MESEVAERLDRSCYVLDHENIILIYINLKLATKECPIWGAHLKINPGLHN